MRFGTPGQKGFYLSRIAAGEIHFSIGYSEPKAGTDLASLRTTGGPGRGGVRDRRSNRFCASARSWRVIFTVSAFPCG